MKYLIGNITYRKLSTFTLIFIALLSVTLLTSIFYYDSYARGLILRERVGIYASDGYISVYQTLASSYNTSIPPYKVINYIKENVTIIKEYGVVYTPFIYFNSSNPEVYNQPLGGYSFFIDSSFMNSSIRKIFRTSVDLSSLQDNELLINEKSYEFERYPSLLGSTITVYLLFENRTFVANFTIVGTYSLSVYPETRYYYPYEINEGVTFLSVKGALAYLLSNGTGIIDSTVESLIQKIDYKVFFKFDRNAFSSLDTYSSYQIAVRAARKISIYFSPFVGTFLFFESIFQSLNEYTLQHLAVLFIFVLPVLILSIIVLKFVFETSAVRRRREISILKSRGFTNKELVLLSIVELCIYSLVTSIFSIILGNLVAYYFISSSLSAEVDLLSMIISSFTRGFDIVATFFASLTFMFLSFSNTLLYSISAEATEARRYYTQESEEIRLSGFEIISVFLVGTFALPLLLSPYSISFLLSVASSISALSVFAIIPTIFLAYFIYILIKIGLLVLVNLKKLFISLMEKIKETTASKMLSRYLIYRKKSEGFAIFAIFLAISITFSSIAFLAISQNYLHDISYYYVGSDISFKYPTSSFENVSYVIDEISSLQEVAGVSVVYVGQGYVYTRSYYGISLTSCTVIAIDEHFPEVAYIEDYFLDKELVKLVSKSKSFAISSYIQYDRYEERRDITARILYSNESYYKQITFEIVGDSHYIPGVTAQFSTSTFIVISKSVVSDVLKNFTKSILFLVKVSDSSTLAKLKESINDVLNKYVSNNTIQINVAKDYYDALMNSIENKTTFGFLYLVFGTTLLFIVVGQGILYFDKFEKTKKDLVILKTMGISSKGLASLIYLDTLINTVIAILFGLALSIIFLVTYSLSIPTILYLGELRTSISSFPLQFVTPDNEWLLSTLLLVITLLIVNLPILRRIIKMNIAKVIKYEFG
ncbi:MAG: FtsX-like permease family protein [Candidatus Asgardarchaeia archaeon]